MTAVDLETRPIHPGTRPTAIPAPGTGTQGRPR